MRLRKLLWTFSAGIMILSGCATGKEAREVARGTLAEIIKYEELVEKKIGAEQAYYKGSVSVLEESLKEGQITEAYGIVTRAVQDFQGEVSLLPQDKDYQSNDLRNAIERVLKSLQQSADLHANRLSEYNEDLLKSLEALELHKQSLAKVRKGLEKLQAERSEIERAKEFYEFAEKTKKEFKGSATQN